MSTNLFPKEIEIITYQHPNHDEDHKYLSENQEFAKNLKTSINEMYKIEPSNRNFLFCTHGNFRIEYWHNYEYENPYRLISSPHWPIYDNNHNINGYGLCSDNVNDLTNVAFYKQLKALKNNDHKINPIYRFKYNVIEFHQNIGLNFYFKIPNNVDFWKLNSNQITKLHQFFQKIVSDLSMDLSDYIIDAKNENEKLIQGWNCFNWNHFNTDWWEWNDENIRWMIKLEKTYYPMKINVHISSDENNRCQIDMFIKDYDVMKKVKKFNLLKKFKEDNLLYQYLKNYDFNYLNQENTKTFKK